MDDVYEIVDFNFIVWKEKRLSFALRFSPQRSLCDNASGSKPKKAKQFAL